MKKLYANIVCMFVFSESKKRKVRMNIRYGKYIKSCMNFVRSVNKDKKCKLKQFFGYGCQNMMISLNNKWIFKFPLPKNGLVNNTRAEKEKRIYDAFKDISPIKLPNMELLDFDGIIVRKYEYINGCKVLSEFKPSVIEKYRQKIAYQIAEFLYIIGKSDPKQIKDLKPSINAKPTFLYGWCQNDVGGNFLIDKRTMKIKYFIDWEDTQFISFKPTLYSCANYWKKNGCCELIVDVLEQYAKLYYKK